MNRWSTGFTVLSSAAAVTAVLCAASMYPVWYVLEAAAMVGCMILLSDPHIDQAHPKWEVNI